MARCGLEPEKKVNNFSTPTGEIKSIEVELLPGKTDHATREAFAKMVSVKKSH